MLTILDVFVISMYPMLHCWLRNALTGYYLTLIFLKDAWDERGAKLWLSFLPRETSLNTLYPCRNLLQSFFCGCFTQYMFPVEA